jgi:succinoglycan biosynthesis transport protein ExoP
MSHSNDDHPQVPSTPPVTVGGPNPGDALIPGGTSFPPSTTVVSTPGGPRSPEVISGGMDRSWFYHSLRRRWLLVLGMGLVLSLGTAGLLWWLFPQSASAVALFQVSSEEQSLAFSGMSNETRQFEILQKTQLALLKSYFVLQDAVRNPDISSLATIANEDDPIQWLDDNLHVSFPQESEILKISISGSENPIELQKIVDAVAKAYEDRVIYAARTKKLSTREVLSRSLGDLQSEIRRKMEDFEDLAKELGTSEGEVGTDAESRILLSEMRAQTEALTTMRQQLLQAQTEFEIIQRQLKDPSVLESQIDANLAADPQVAMMQNQLMSIDMQLQDLQSRSRRSSPALQRLMREKQNIQQRIAQYRSQAKQQAAASEQNSPNAMLRQVTGDYRIRSAMLLREMENIQRQLESSKEILLSKGEKSLELTVRDAELEQLKEIAHEMSLKIESWDIEMNAPQRILQIQQAQITPGINTIQRYLIASFGGVAAFALTCLGIAYMEFRNRRLNGPGQVDEGLGIRVVGTLPALSSRRLLDPNHPLVAQLTESIDGVRTLLMHDATSKQRQVVLVTSAMTLEGRTTVASQLAASLARAGRRTLLVDGDLRRPALHALFDVPLEDGLCEVLRAEANVADVIRPSHAEGLWLLTAGYCDVDSIQALATVQLKPVFEKLRSDYDFIVIDGPPILGLSDSLLLGQYCDGARLSVLRDHSEVPKIYQAAELLRGVGIRLLGAVVNGVSTSADRRVTQLRLSAPKAEREQLQEI